MGNQISLILFSWLPFLNVYLMQIIFKAEKEELAESKDTMAKSLNETILELEKSLEEEFEAKVAMQMELKGVQEKFDVLNDEKCKESDRLRSEAQDAQRNSEALLKEIEQIKIEKDGQVQAVVIMKNEYEQIVQVKY